MFDAVSVFQAPVPPRRRRRRAGGRAHRCPRAARARWWSARSSTAPVTDTACTRACASSEPSTSVAAGTGAAVQERHARHHAAYAAPARARVRVPGDVGVLRELDASVADLRAAERWFEEHGTVEERLRFALDLRDYGFYRMRPEVLGWAENAARAAMAGASPSGLAGEAFAAASLEAWNRGDLERGTELIRLGPRRRGGHGRGPRLLRAREHRAPRRHQRPARGRAGPPPGRRGHPGGRRADRFCRVESLGSTVLALGYADDPRTAATVATLQAELADASEISAAWAWYTIGEVLVQSDPATAASHLARALDLADRCGATFVTMIAGASAASIEARTAIRPRPIEQYRWLLELGQRAGVRVLQWTMLRSVAELLVRVGDHAGAATLLGAVTTPGSGHEIFGADVERLDNVRKAVRSALGDAVGRRRDRPGDGPRRRRRGGRGARGLRRLRNPLSRAVAAV